MKSGLSESLRGRISELREGIDESWSVIFDDEDISALLDSSIDLLANKLESYGVVYSDDLNVDSYIRPRFSNILAAFRYCTLEETKCVIIGQDPYPDPESATGLSFSVPKGAPPPSTFKNIHKCLYAQGLTAEDTITNANLEHWAQQGVLLLNVFLTRSPYIVDGEYISENGDKTTKNACLHVFWKDFTLMLIEKISAALTHNISIIAWGAPALKLVDSIDGVLTWTHPSPASIINNKTENSMHFIHCDNFTRVNDSLTEQGLSPINWDLSLPKPITIFTDGGCTGNGRDDAVASYAAYFVAPGFVVDGFVFYGRVPATDIAEINEHYALKYNDTVRAPTNNRGELMGVIRALLLVLKLGISAQPVRLVMDSTYCKNIVEKWIAGWARKNKTFSDRQNSDMLRILWQLMGYCDKLGIELICVHQRAHGTGTDELSVGNRIADAACSEVISAADCLMRVKKA